MSWLNPERYSLPVVLSVGLHILVASLFLLEWPTEHRVPEPVPPHVVATVVQVESAAEKQRKQQAEKQKKRQELAAKREAERKKKLAEQKKREAEQKKKQAAAKKREQEKALKEKALAEKQAKDKAAKEKASKEKAAEQAKQKAAQEQALLEQMAQEEAAAELKEQQEAKIQAERAAALTLEFTDQIKARVESVWRYPPAVTASQEVEVRITLVPTGQVIRVQITKGSGNAALDRSVEQAVYKASPLPVPKDVRVFEENFRSFLMKFRPENATW